MVARVSTLGLVVIVLLMAGGARPFQARPHAQQPDTLGALLVEVRGLRAAMEQLASAGPRVQLAFGRLQMQEQRINALVRRLESIRDRIAPLVREEDEVRTRAGRFEEALKTISDADEKKALEQQIPMLRLDATRLASQVQALQSEEAAINAEIALEQGRWSDINRALDELERALGKR